MVFLTQNIFKHRRYDLAYQASLRNACDGNLTFHVPVGDQHIIRNNTPYPWFSLFFLVHINYL